MKNAYAVSRLRKKTGYTKNQFYDQAFKIYKEVLIIISLGKACIILSFTLYWLEFHIYFMYAKIYKESWL
jgi:hypothetical protein